MRCLFLSCNFQSAISRSAMFSLVLFSLALSRDPQRQDKFGNKEDDFNAAENWKSSEKTHCATNKTKSCLHAHFDIVLHIVVGGACKEDLDHSQRTMFDGCSWGLMVLAFYGCVLYVLRFAKFGSNLRFFAKELLYCEYCFVMTSSLPWSSNSSCFL